LLLVGLAGLLLYLRRRRLRVGEPELTPEDRVRAHALLQERDPDTVAR
jgi:hypothetical protein